MAGRISEADLKRILQQDGYTVVGEKRPLAARKAEALRVVEGSLHSRLEEKFAGLYRQAGGSRVWERDYLYDLPDSRMEFDFALPEIMLAVEVNGGQGRGNQSGHSNWKGLERDARKQNSAQRKGWSLFVLTTSMVTYEQVERIAAEVEERYARHDQDGTGRASERE